MKQSSIKRIEIYRSELDQVFGDFSTVKSDFFSLISDASDLNICGLSVARHSGENVLLAGSISGNSKVIAFENCKYFSDLILYTEAEQNLDSFKEYIKRWKLFLKLLATSKRLTSRSHELSLVTGRLIETTDQLVSLHDLIKGLPDALNSQDLDRFLICQVANIFDCSAALFVNNDADHIYLNESDLNPALLDFWNQSAGANRIFRSESTGLDADVVVVNFVESGKGGFVLCSRARISTEHNRIIQTVAAHSDGVLAVANLQKVQMVNAMLNRDIELASALADRVMPKTLPEISGVDLAARCNYARMASGDFYSCFATPYGGVVAVGDISGKGLPAAIVMSIASSVLSLVVKQVNGPNPDEIISHVSKELFAYLSSAGVFITLAVATWDQSQSLMKVANAGHSPVALVGEEVLVVESSAPPLGVISECFVENQIHKLLPGDFLFLGSDGLVEQENSAGLMLGYDSLFDFILKNRDVSSNKLVNSLFDLVENFAERHPQDDDRTALILRRV